MYKTLIQLPLHFFLFGLFWPFITGRRATVWCWRVLSVQLDPTLIISLCSWPIITVHWFITEGGWCSSFHLIAEKKKKHKHDTIQTSITDHMLFPTITNQQCFQWQSLTTNVPNDSPLITIVEKKRTITDQKCFQGPITNHRSFLQTLIHIVIPTHALSYSILIPFVVEFISNKNVIRYHFLYFLLK